MQVAIVVVIMDILKFKYLFFRILYLSKNKKVLEVIRLTTAIL